MKFFHPSVRLTNKSQARLFPFDKPIKSLYFRSFVVSVLFARFHFKVIRKSLYLWTKMFEQLIILSYNGDVFKLPQGLPEYPGCNQ